MLGILRSGLEILAATLPLVHIYYLNFLLTLRKITLTAENKIIFERLMKILELHPNILVKKLVLATIKEIAERNDDQIKVDFQLSINQV